MKKIEENMMHAIRHGKAWKHGDTRTERTLPHENVAGLRVYLHGNQIAFIPDDETQPLKITLAGWDTNTTRSRLDCIIYPFCGCTIGRVKGETTITFRRQPHTSGYGTYRPSADEWVTLSRA